MKDQLKIIIDRLNNSGQMEFVDGVNENDILDFEKNNAIKIPNELREWYLYSDGGELFLPGGVQLYGLKHNPIIDVNDFDRPNDNYYVIGRLSYGDPILCEKNSDRISIYNHETGAIENDETYDDFFEFLDSLQEILGEL